MLEKDTLIKVLNRDNGRVGYTVPEIGVRREFMPGETKEIPFHELQKLSWVPGGMPILKDCLVIQDAEALQSILGGVEPEYHYTPADVKELLLYGSLDQLKDCLDFAPTGVIDLVKSMSVELELNDVQKRKAIFEAIGFNVTKAIEINQASKETSEDEAEAPSGRRAAPINAAAAEPAAPARRTSAPVPPKYNVVVRE